MREVEALTAVPGLDGGIAELQLAGKGNPSNFTVDGNAKVTGAAYRIPEVQVSGVNGSTNIHITQDEIALTAHQSASARRRQRGRGTHLANWLAPTPAAPTRKEAVAAVAKKSQNLPAPAVGTVASGNIRAQIRDVTLRSVMRMVAPKRYQDLGFDTVGQRPGERAVDGQRRRRKGDGQCCAGGGQWARRRSAERSGRRHLRQSPRSGRHPPSDRADAGQPHSGAGRAGRLSAEARVGDPGRSGYDESGRIRQDAQRCLGFRPRAGGQEDRSRGDPGAAPWKRGISADGSGSLMRPDVKGHLTATNFDTVFATPEAGSRISAGDAIGVLPMCRRPQSVAASQQTGGRLQRHRRLRR